MKKLVIAIIIIILLIIAAAFFFLAGRQDTEDKDSKTATDAENEGTTSDTTTAGDSSGAGAGSGAGGGSGGDGGEVGGAGSETLPPEQLPLDLEERECGYYFPEYGACTGLCPSGTCTQEGRSCYCKK